MKSIRQIALVAAALIASGAVYASSLADEQATLMNSVDVVVPTESLPVLFKLTNSNCYVVGNAKTDLATERLHVSAEKMSCMESDKVIERKINGYVVDADGTNGLRIKLASRPMRTGLHDMALYGHVDAGVKAIFVFKEI